MKSIFAVVLTLAFLLAGCSVPAAIVERVADRFDTDLVRTSELAKAYNKLEVAKCSDFLLATLRGREDAMSKLDALSKEPTAGILSAALKAALMAELGRSLIEQDKAKFEVEFRTNCNAVAGDIMIKLLQDSAKVVRRGN